DDCEGANFHRPPATSSSFPVTTPEATVMRAFPEIGICTRAMPRLMGASTVVFPEESVLVKLTTVPSGTAFPLQSRTGSVWIQSWRFSQPADLIRKLQASEATC